MKVLIINGPNLNLLGKREPEIYGKHTLDDVESMCKSKAELLSIDCGFYQSNSEGDIVSKIHESISDKCDAIIINAGAYTHSSIAIRDALLNFEGSIIEIHISNIFKREKFRHHSYISDIASGVICGLGTKVYTLALEALKD